jgi:hypothetical protein
MKSWKRKKKRKKKKSKFTSIWIELNHKRLLGTNHNYLRNHSYNLVVSYIII